MNDRISNLRAYLRRALAIYKEEAGQSYVLWVFIALASFATQIVLRRELLPGEFGTLNTALGVIGLMTIPLLAVNMAFAWHLTRKHGPSQEERLAALRPAALLVTETFAWTWGLISGLLLFSTLALIQLPRFPLHLFTLLCVLIALGGILSGVVCRSNGRLRQWGWLLAISAVVRFLVGGTMAHSEPWAESGLAAFIIAGLITFAPTLSHSELEESERVKALKTVARDRVFLLDLGATFSVLLAIFLFSSADRIVAQSWFGTVTDNNLGYIDWQMFDAYQTAGLLGRAILWGTQPLLLILFVQRSQLDKTTPASLDWFWIYIGALVTGITFLELFNIPLSLLFCGHDFSRTSHLVPGFAMTMIPLGLLQGLGMFGLASRRYPECFVLGGCSLAYLALLFCVGRQPALTLAYMFGGGLVALMIVLFVGVVRWGRKQP